MSTELTTPLADIIKRAAAREVEGPAAKIKKRFDHATDDVIALLDVSGSMGDLIGSQGMTKYQHLLVALKDAMLAFPKLKLVAFATNSRVLNGLKDLPPDLERICGALGGGTDLTHALEHIARFKPKKTILITDGLPDNEQTATTAAEALTGAIDTIYCGPDSHPAVQFLRKLARDTGGVDVTWDGYKPLGASIRALLCAPTG